MQSNIFELIDLLVKMSGSKSNLDELKADLDDTESRILKVQKKLDSLEEEMNDDKYFDASSEIVDRNIRISLVKKIQKLNNVKNDITKDLDSIKSEEITTHNELENVRDEISSANKYLDTISKNDSSSESYKNMIASENDRIAHLVAKKDDIEEKYNSIQKKVEYLAASLDEVNDKIAKENERLDEIDNNLSNVKAYIDLDTKEKDENKYLDIKGQLDNLMAHKNEILEDAVYIAGTIKELIADEKKDEIEDEFDHLVNVVKSIPYMGLENENIEDEKNKLTESLQNYDTEISQKEYQTMDKEFIDERITYLKDSIKKNNNELRDVDKKIESINEDNDILSSKVYNAEVQISKIDSSLIDYEVYNYDDENELPKSVVLASNNKLLEEKENIASITEKYREDIVNNINELNSINTRKDFLKLDNENKENELEELEKKTALSTKSSNILEEEKDKIKLEKINNAILDLKNREKFSKSISSIVEEFEMLLSSLEFVDKETRSRIMYEDTKENDKEEIKEELPVYTEKVDEPEAGKEEIVEEAPEETPIEDKNIETPVTFETVETTDEFPIIDEIEEETSKNSDEEENKLKVLELYDIPGDLSENSDQDYMVNDFQDDDYVDLETAISSMEDK